MDIVEEDMSSSDDQETDRPLRLGGPSLCSTPALFVLDGIDESTKQRITIPVHKVPVVLGRQHDPKDTTVNFVSLGASKSISRLHLEIQYLFPLSKTKLGRLDNTKSANGSFVIQTSQPMLKSSLLTTTATTDSATSQGFSLKVLGKNRVLVDRTLVPPQQSCWLTSSSSIRVGTLCLYLLLPSEQKRSSECLYLSDEEEQRPTKRRLSVSTAQPVAAPSLVAKQPQKSNKTQEYQTQLQNMSTEELLDKLQAGVENGTWDRKLQMVGHVVAGRAVLDAATALQQSTQQESFSRGDIMDWIQGSQLYGKRFVANMLSNMNASSYQSTVITNALVKMGFDRTASHGRFIKWIPPDRVAAPTKEGTDKEGPAATADDES